MSLDLDHVRRRLSMAAVPGFSGAGVSRAVARLLGQQPRVASYDFVFDVRGSPTGSTPADFDIVLGAYREIAREPGVKYGCYVTRDSHYPLWAGAMAELFGDRQCPVFPTPEAAHAFLDRVRAPEAASQAAALRRSAGAWPDARPALSPPPRR